MIKNEVTQFLADRLGVSSQTLNLKQSASKLIHDDFDLIDIVMDLESKFDVVISDDIEFSNLIDIVSCVEQAVSVPMNKIA